MTVKKVGVRLQPEGGREVIDEVRKVETALDGMSQAGVAGASRSTSSTRKQVDALREVALAAAQTETALQRQINAAIGVSRGGNASAAVAARTLVAADDGYERRAAALKAELDPAAAAQDRLNKELAEYASLAARGKISTDQLAQAQVRARQKYDESALAISRQEKGLSRLAMASRLNLTRQAADVFTTAAMGMNPAMIAIQQGPQIADAFATSNIKLHASLLLVAGGVGVAAVAVAASVAAWMEAEKQALAYERAATGVGRTAKLTAQQIQNAAEAGADAGNVSIKAASEQAAAYASTGRIGAETMEGLISIGKDYASFMGVEAADATKALAKAMLEPDTAARDMTRSFGLLDQKTLDHIDTLVKLGDKHSAQKILLEELTEAVRGHGDRVGELDSFWDSATQKMSNYWTRLGQALYTTRDERIDKLQAELAPGALSAGQALDPQSRSRKQAELVVLTFKRDWGAREASHVAQEASQNQSAQDARDRHDKGKADRDRASREAEERRREAERIAREALQRQRREEDRTGSLDRQVAQVTQDFDSLRQLEAEERVRRRIRELVDDGVAAAQAQTTAKAEELRLADAMAAQSVRETAEIGRQVDFDVMRLLGEEGLLGLATDRADLQKRILDYQQKGLDIATATAAALADQGQLTEARAEAQRRVVQEAEAEHRLNLARLAGDDDLYRILDREDRIQRRAREIERRESLNRGDGRTRAIAEIQSELDAEAVGARRVWISGLLDDIHRSGIGDALANQLDRATSRWLDKLSDSLAELNWSGAFKQMFSGSSGGISGVFEALFSDAPGHSAGTAFSPGGLRWVGERGPELVRLGRGTEVNEHNRSMQMMGAGGGAATINLGGLHIKNYGEPSTGKVQQMPNGGLELILEPLMDGHMAKRGRDGSLKKAAGMAPAPLLR